MVHRPQSTAELSQKLFGVSLAIASDWQDKHEALFLAFQEPLSWKPDLMCDTAPAAGRAKWLMENKGMNEVRQHVGGSARGNLMV